jgi:hypothetical protein
MPAGTDRACAVKNIRANYRERRLEDAKLHIRQEKTDHSA